MKLTCRLIGHQWSGWVGHTRGPCVFESCIHIFRKCERCPKNQHDFVEVQNGYDEGEMQEDGSLPDLD